MRHGLLLALSALIVLTLSGGASAQTEMKDTPAPEVKEIKVSANNRLSVNLQDAYFGDVMKDIGKQAGFEVRIGSAVYEKKVSTSFTDMELERGINRLLTLISQKTYFIHYGPEGSISRIDIFTPGEGAGPGPSRDSRPSWTPPASPAPQRPAVMPQPARQLNQQGLTVEQAQPAQEESAPQPLLEQEGVEFVGEEAPASDMGQGVGDEPPEPAGDTGLGVEEEKPDEVPYIPPKREPAFIPRNPR